MVREGRRWGDWHMLSSGRSLFFWVFGMFLGERHKPSMSRIMLAAWTWVGWRMIAHELALTAADPALQNAAWGAWATAESMLAVAVFGPSVASYMSSGGAGAAVAALGSAVRSEVEKVKATITGDPG